MPLVSIEYPAGQLSVAQKATLAEELTAVMLEIEGGGDTPFGRAGTLIRFRELPRSDWFVGGSNGDAFVQGRPIFLVEIYVPEGLLDQPRTTRAHQAVTEALARAIDAGEDQRRYFWVQVFEWADGSLASNGGTTDLFGIARRAGHPESHPVLEFPRQYFAAKNRMLDAHGFPATTGGRASNRY